MTDWLFFLSCLSAGIYVLWPLYEKNRIQTWLLPEDTALSYLQEKKTSIYNNIKDLDFDFAMGKLSLNDYHRIRAEFKQEAAQILQQLDQMDEKFKKEIQMTEPQKCRACRKTVPSNAKFCPECGEKQ
jgi:hypothetical protein